MNHIAKYIILSTISAAVLTACGGGGGGGSTADKQNPTPITPTDTITTPVDTTPTPTPTTPAVSGPVANVPAPDYTDADRLAVFNVLNQDRANCGFGKVAQDSHLDAAAQGHADYLMLNKTAGHGEIAGNPGYIGARAVNRAIAMGYDYPYVAEIIGYTGTGSWFAAPNANGLPPGSMTELSATNTLRKLYSSTYHLAWAMSPLKDVGLGVSVTNNDSVNWTSNSKSLVINFGLKRGVAEQDIDRAAVLSFPCEGTDGLMPQYGPEDPEAFTNLFNDYGAIRGQPIYLRSGTGTTINISSATITPVGGAPVKTVLLTYDNDPNPSRKLLKPNDVFVVPVLPLADNTTYEVVIQGNSTGAITNGNPLGTFNKSFKFKTGTYTSE